MVVGTMAKRRDDLTSVIGKRSSLENLRARLGSIVFEEKVEKK